MKINNYCPFASYVMLLLIKSKTMNNNNKIKAKANKTSNAK